MVGLPQSYKLEKKIVNSHLRILIGGRYTAGYSDTCECWKPSLLSAGVCGAFIYIKLYVCLPPIDKLTFLGCVSSAQALFTANISIGGPNSTSANALAILVRKI